MMLAWRLPASQKAPKAPMDTIGRPAEDMTHDASESQQRVASAAAKLAFTPPSYPASTAAKVHVQSSSTLVMPRTSAMVIGVLSSIVVTALVAQKWGLPAWNIVQGSCQFSLFILGCWLLPRDHSAQQPGPSIRALGATFSCLRMVAYLRAAILAPAYYQKLLATTWSLAVLGVYIAEATLLQALWHRLLPLPVCNLLGSFQALLFTIMSYRLTSGDMPWWRMLHLVISPQVGMFLPYHLLSHPRIQQLTRSTAASSSSQSPASSSQSQELPGQQSRPAKQPHAVVGGILASAATAAETAPVAAGHVPGCEGVLSTEAKPLSKDLQASLLASMHAAKMAPYQSRLRISHKVCVKLDTTLPCSTLPPDVALQLQSALRSSIGYATSLNISDVAVRPGCICITMNVEEELPADDDAPQPPTQSPLRPDDLARALLPELQRMLSKGTEPAVHRSNMQLDGRLVTCSWSKENQAWEVQVCPRGFEGVAADDDPWLGVATTASMKRATGHAEGSAAATSPSGLLELLAEVQLWGVSKVADVEGWTPPQQHDDNEAQWPSAQQPSGSSAALKLLARAAGGYLPTQVLRLIPGSNDAYVTAQVLMQLPEQQLIRHHVSGTSSMLLLINMELWQNEVLLSSSPLLSAPASREDSNVPERNAWWWGSSDSTVARALAELQQCAEKCMQAVSEEDAPAAIQTYVQYLQDLSVWLLQVQRTAYAGGLCQYGTPCKAKGLAALLQQPTLPPAALCNLGQDLVQYARLMGWRQVQSMVIQQLRGVVRPAAGTGTTWFRLLPRGVRVSIIGYPCQHDEQLYQQQLAEHLSQVLIVSSGATALISFVWGIRVLAWKGLQLLALFASTWMGLHLAALVLMVQNQRSRKTASPAATLRRMRCAYVCVALVYVWRLVAHLLLTTVLTSQSSMYNLAFQQPRLWATSQLVFALTEQVPAYVVLPASWSFAICLLLEFPGLLIPVMRGAAWHPAVSVGVTFLLSVGARVMLGLQLRRQLRTSSLQARAVNGDLAHAKID